MRMNIEDCSPEVLKEAVSYMYGVDIDKDFNDLIGLLEIAERFLMEDLKEETGNRMAETVGDNNFLEFSRAADKLNLKSLIEKCVKYIMFKSRVVNWEAVLEMPRVNMCFLKMSKEMMEKQEYADSHYRSCLNCGGPFKVRSCHYVLT